jgi:hypothetical protein
VSACDALLLRAEGAAGLRTAARAETGAPLVPERTEPLLAGPVPFVVGAWFRVGVRLAAAGDDDEVLAAVSRRGVPAAGGLVAAAVDIVCLCVFCFSL